MVSPAASWPRTALTVTRVSRTQGRPLIQFGSMEIRSYATPEAYVERSPSAERTASSAPPIAIRQTIDGQYVDWRQAPADLGALDNPCRSAREVHGLAAARRR